MTEFFLIDEALALPGNGRCACTAQSLLLLRILKILLGLRTSLFQKLGVLHWNKISIILEQTKANALEAERSLIFVDDIVLIAESREKCTDLTGRPTYKNTDTWIWHGTKY